MNCTIGQIKNQVLNDVMKKPLLNSLMSLTNRFAAIMLVLSIPLLSTTSANADTTSSAFKAMSETVTMTLLTTPPANGFRPGDLFQVQVLVTGVDNNTGAFRVDLLDYPMIGNNFKTSTQNNGNTLRFGYNMILREAEFSHGIFLRTSVGSQSPPKTAEIIEETIEFAEYSNAYTWLIDTRFRNGSLQVSDVATMILTLEYVMGVDYDVDKISDINSEDYTLYIDYTNTDGYTGGSRNLDVTIDKDGYITPSGVRHFTTKIAPSGLMAGEPYLIEIGVIKYGYYDPSSYSTDLFINQGFTPFSINTFYSTVLPNTSPSHLNGSPLEYTSLSFASGYLEYDYAYNKSVESTDKINEGYYNPFLLTYQPTNNRFNVRSISYNCYDIYSSSDDGSCGVTPIYMYANTISRLFIQGVATLEKAGAEATIQGELAFYSNTQKVAASSPSTTNAAPVNINESFDIGAFSFAKTVSDDCFEEGEEGYFDLTVTGADLKKTSSIFIMIDKVPVNTELLQASLFFKGDNGQSDNEIAFIAKEEEGVALYGFQNANYFWFQGKRTEVSKIQNGGPVYTYDWYDSYTMRMDFKISGETIEPGDRTNTGIFVFETPLFTYSYWQDTKIAYQGVLFSDFEDVDIEQLNFQYQLILAIQEIPVVVELGMFNSATADYSIGCANITVSGYKFEDHNADGVRDQGDQGLEGWTIILQSSAGTFTTTTDANGFYQFEDLKPGVYQLREEPKDGWRQSYPAGEGFYNMSLSSAIQTFTGDFGNYRPAHVSGFKYTDMDGSGSRDQGEPAMEGVRVYLLDMNGNQVDEAFTDADGYFAFGGLEPGNYALYEDIPEGMYQSQPGPATGGFYYLLLSSGEQAGPKYFGNYILTSIEGLVYYEGSAPPKSVTGGSILSDRFAAPGVIVTGVRTGPAPLKPAVDPLLLPGASSFEIATDENGYFKVDGLLPGLYTLAVQPPEFAQVITQNPLTEVLVSGGFVEIEFGLFYDALSAPEPSGGSITGSLYRDANANGLWAFPSETGIEGRTVTLVGASSRGLPVNRTTTTDSNGTYTFGNLPAGSYVVSAPSSAGFSTSTPLGGSYAVELGVNEHLGAGPSGAPGGAGWLSSTDDGSDVSFARMTLAIDLNLDGVADTRVDVAGKAWFSLGGLRGQTSRPLELEKVEMYGLADDGHRLTLTTPGLVAADGTIIGPGALVDKDLRASLVLTHDEDDFWMSEGPISFNGKADRWPLRHSRATYDVGAGPVNLRDPNGNVVARIVYAEITTLYGVDFAAERADFGDAPATYGTLRAVPGDPFTLTSSGIVYPLDGARHLMPWTGMPALTLGPTVTADANGQPTDDANGDFDNGVVLPAAVAPNAAFNATVTVNGTGLLSIWVDQNRNGVFEASEKLVSDKSVETGEHAIALHSGSVNTSGVTYVRVRLTTQAGVGPTGLALDGEVEDYKLVIDAALAGGGGGLPTSDDGDEAIPTSFALHQNYPNPFNPTTVIPYDLASTSRVRITVYDVTGRPVASLLDAQQNAGRHQVTFNAAGLPSGVYMVRLEAGGQLMVRKLTLLK